ncbi:translocation/assembly module TamB domain-containing protein [Enhygromyxa salina]|uniref:Translocation and assembly module TamB n=1 Tax=Enhygromyxa salina TaxID=215803 RepID=A0A2S9YFR8_9BACT|nr:translocation/assembly module TamB [Enhygromyxa salina]PRQ03950.1 Translocation and assembly module TamB [Enhygromyxa salina]
MSDPETAPRGRRRRRSGRLRAWLRWSVGVLFGLVTLVLAAVLVIAWVPAVSQPVIRAALSRWDASIPGEVVHGDIAGSIGGGLTIDGLELRDADGRPLVRAGRVELDLDMVRLFAGGISIERAWVRDATVWADHDWSSLGSSDAGPPAPREGWGPDLPVEIDAVIEIEAGEVVADAQTLAQLEHLRLDAAGVGRRAQVELELRGVELPGQQLHVDSLALGGRWDAPVATLERLRVQSPDATLRLLEPSRFDVSTRSGAVAIELKGEVHELAERLGVDAPPGLDQARVRVRGHGGPTRIELRSEAELGPGTVFSLSAALTPEPVASECRRLLGVELDGRVAAGLLHSRQGPLTVSLSTVITSRHAPAPGCPELAEVVTTPGQLELGAELRVTDVDSGEQLALDLGGIGTGVSPPRGQLGLELRGPALAGRIELAASAARTLSARGAVVVDELHAPLSIVARLLDEPRLATVRGRLALTGSCRTDPHAELETLRCPMSVALDELDGFDTHVAHASLDAELAPLREPLRFRARLGVEDLRRDELVLDMARLRAEGTPASFSLWALGRGPRERVELAASVDRRAQTTIIGLDQLVVDSRRGAAPIHVALVEPTRIVIAPERVGVEALALRAAGGRIYVDGQLGRAEQPSDLRFELAAVELGRVDPLVPGPALRGRVDAQGRLAGSLARPQGWVEFDAQALAIGQLVLGDLELAARFCEPLDAPPAAPRGRLRSKGEPCTSAARGDLQLWADLRGPIADRIELAARVPLRLDDGVALSRARPLAVRLQLEGLSLVELGAVMPRTPSWWRQVPPDAAAPPGDPRLIPEGRVDLDLAVSGPSDRPQIDLAAVARELVVDHTALGSLAVRATLDDTGLGVSLDAKPGIATLSLDAKLPLALDLARVAWDWDREAAHTLSLELRRLSLDALERVLGPKIPALAAALDAAELGGLVSASIRAEGPASAPRLAAQLRAHGLTHRGEALGHASVGVEHEGVTTDAIVALRGPLARRLDARLVVPLRLALDRTPSVELDAAAPLRAEVHARGAELAKITQHLRGSAVIAGRGDLELRVDGSLSTPTLELRGRVDALSLGDDRVGDLSVHATASRERAQIHSDLVRGGEHVMSAAVVVPLAVNLDDLGAPQIAWDHTGHHRVLATGRGIDDELLAALSGGRARLTAVDPSGSGRAFGIAEVNTELDFDLVGGGRSSDFSLVGEVHGRVTADGEQTLTLDATLDLDELRQRVSLDLAPSSCDALVVRGELGADVARLLAGAQRSSEVPFRVSVDAPDFELDTIAPLLATVIHDPRGTLRAELVARGTLAAPHLHGQVEVHDGALTPLALRQRLRDIELDLRLDDRVVELRELAVVAGAGHASARGRGEFGPADLFEAGIDLEVQGFPLIRPGLPAMTINSDVDLNLRLDADAAKLRVALAQTEVTVAGVNPSPPEPVPTSDAVEFVAADATTRDPATGVDETAGDAEVIDTPELALRLRLLDPLQISGPTIDMAWTGTLGVDRRGPSVDLLGQLEARRGRFYLLGRRFELQTGTVTMAADGSLDPYLDIVAVTQMPEVEVTVTIRGRASRPELHFHSTPALSEMQIVTLLVTGSTEVGEGEGSVEAKAASLLAAVSSPELQRQLNRSLGIDRVALGFGAGIDQPILSIGKRVTDDLWVETTYRHNAPEDKNTAEIEVQYNFTRRWTLETFFGDAAIGGVGLYWTRSFGAAPWRAPPAPPKAKAKAEAKAEAEADRE